MKNKILVERLLNALNHVRIGDCWCGKGQEPWHPAIGPQRDHTLACREAAEVAYAAQRELSQK